MPIIDIHNFGEFVDYVQRKVMESIPDSVDRRPYSVLSSYKTPTDLLSASAKFNSLLELAEKHSIKILVKYKGKILDISMNDARNSIFEDSIKLLHNKNGSQLHRMLDGYISESTATAFMFPLSTNGQLYPPSKLLKLIVGSHLNRATKGIIFPSGKLSKKKED